MALFPAQPSAGQEVYDPASDRWFRYNESGYWELLDADKYLVRGKPGPQGVQGPVGATGPKGSSGAQGNTGATGAKGSKGSKGDKGEDGRQGVQGVPGDAICYEVKTAPARGDRGKLFITAQNEIFVATGLY